MKHELSYEPTWKRVLSEQDHQLIERIFKKTSLPKEGEVQFTAVRAAYNHRGDLIATALIQNHQSVPFLITNLFLAYEEAGEKVAEHIFSISRLNIPPHTTMPWSFLFPKESQQKKASLREWKLKEVPINEK